MKTGIFQLTAADRPALTQHLLRLSPADRRLRFLCLLGDSAIKRFVATVAVEQVYGFFVAGELIATSMVMPEGADRVEFAVSVDAQHRGRGLGRDLLNHGLDSIWADRAQHLVIRHATDNHAMAALHKGLPSQRRYHAGEVDVLVDLEELRSERRDTMSRLVGEEL